VTAGNKNAGSVAGTGTVQINAGTSLTSDGIQAANLNVNGAQTFRTIGTGAGFSKVTTLSIAHTGSGTSATYTGSVNLADSRFVVQASSAAAKPGALSDLASAIRAGSNGGLWNGKGITSSTAAGDSAHVAVGVFDNAILNLTNFGGAGNVDSNSILVAASHLGDANRSGVVDIQDQSLVTNNWQKPSNNWAAGDLNLDGIVDIQDLTLVTNNWQQTSSLSLGIGSDSALSITTQSVPEPSTVAALAVPAALLIRRKRSRR
jgi:hypothetical protein